MADISIKRTHALGLKGAKVAADKMAEKLGEKFDLAGDWDGHTLEFQRPGVNGFLSITETHMTLEVSLGFMLKMMKGPIENAVHEQLDKVLASPSKAPAKSVPKITVAKKTTAKKPATRKK